MKKEIKFNEVYGSKNGDFEVLLKIKNHKNKYLIRFVDYDYSCIVNKINIINRNPFNPYLKTVYGIGYQGLFRNIYKKSPSNERLYNVWRNMLSRCYDPKNIRYNCYGGTGVTVHEDWHNFTTFYKEVQRLEGWKDELFTEYTKELDKDLKQDWNCKNKIYSKETCVWRDKDENNQDQGHKMSVRCINNGMEFDTLAKAGKYAGVNYWSIRKCADGRQNHAGKHPETGENLKWEFI